MKWGLSPGCIILLLLDRSESRYSMCMLAVRWAWQESGLRDQQMPIVCDCRKVLTYRSWWALELFNLLVFLLKLSQSRKTLLVSARTLLARRSTLISTVANIRIGDYTLREHLTICGITRRISTGGLFYVSTIISKYKVLKIGLIVFGDVMSLHLLTSNTRI